MDNNTAENTAPQVQVVAPGATPVSQVVEPQKRRGVPKAAIIAIVALVILAILAAIVFVVLPKIRGGSSGAPATLTWWGIWEDETTVDPVIKAYEAANPNVKINYVKQAKEDYRERLTSSLAKGDGPDIFTIHNSWVPMFKQELDLMPATVMDSSTFSTTFYPVAVSDLVTQSGPVAVPTEYDGLALFVNNDIFTNAGKSFPKTWDDLRQTAIDLTVRDETGVIRQAGVALGRTENVDHWPEILGLMMEQNGVDLNNPVGTKAEVALQYYTLFSSNDHVWDETLPTSTEFFAGGKLAMYFAPSWRAFDIKQANPNLKFSVIPVPQIAKNELSIPDVNYASYWADGVWARSTQKTAAWNFVKFLTEKENYQKFFDAASAVRLFGQPFPRVDMASLLNTNPYVSAYISEAATAKSWYLASRTFDGPTGINSQIDKYFEDAINSLNQPSSSVTPTKALETVNAGVKQVLSTYGITTSQAPATTNVQK